MNTTDAAAIEATLSKLTLAEKVQLCHAATKFSVRGIDRLNIPDMIMSDGPHGVRQEISPDSWAPIETDEDYSSYLPVGTALAATWNPEMARRHGAVLGAEARERGKDVILGPGFNIIRTPLCGRNFEYYSEDPYLISAMVGPAVEGVQAQGTAACAKHYACNSQELNRFQVNAIPSERALREIYLPGFKAAVEAGVLTIMGAYNQLRGQWCCQNDYLLNQVLKKEWGFMGAVMSDWDGVKHNTYEPALGGMDIEMGTNRPFEDYYLARGFLEAIENGEIDEEVVNDKARRYLYVMESIGAMGQRMASRPQGERNTQRHQAECRAIAEEAMVLLKNEEGVLPFSREIKTLLVVGDNATATHHAGGGSSGVKALYEITPLEGLQALLGESVAIEHCPDPAAAAGEAIPNQILSLADAGAGINGWVGALYDHRPAKGAPIREFAANEVNLALDEELLSGIDKESHWVLHFTTTLTAPESGSYSFVMQGVRDASLTVNGAQVIQQRPKADAPDTACGKIDLVAGTAYNLIVRIRPHRTVSGETVALTWLTPGQSSAVSFETLQARARAADAVIYVGGLNHRQDTEGSDRNGFSLPGLQDEVIAALAGANRNFAALMTGGSAYAMPWVDAVPAILHMGYAGMEAGHVAAATLFGKVNPSGKLPFTFPARLEDTPGHALDDYKSDVCFYKEDIYVGYRWFDKHDIAPLFCFGHGLSYTCFDYSDLTVETGAGGVRTVRCTVTNTGPVAGAEVLQLYLHDCESTVGRPPQELKGFDKVFLEPGASTTVTFVLDEGSLAFFHPTRREWVTEEGEFEVRISASSRDCRLKGRFCIGR